MQEECDKGFSLYSHSWDRIYSSQTGDSDKRHANKEAETLNVSHYRIFFVTSDYNLSYRLCFEYRPALSILMFDIEKTYLDVGPNTFHLTETLRQYSLLSWKKSWINFPIATTRNFCLFVFLSFCLLFGHLCSISFVYLSLHYWAVLGCGLYRWS